MRATRLRGRGPSSRGGDRASDRVRNPVLPGKEALDRETFKEMEGPRRSEYEAAMKDAGITRHTVCINKRLTARSLLAGAGHEPVRPRVARSLDAPVEISRLSAKDTG